MKENNTKGMETLNYSSTIEKGIYAGEMVEHCLKRYGKKAIKELLKYYDFCEAIMLDYHFHLEPHVDNTVAAENTTEKKDMAQKAKVEKKDMKVESTKDVAMEDIRTSGDDVFDLTDIVDLDFSNWVESRSDRKDNVLYDPEDDPEEAYLDSLMGVAWLREHGYDYAMATNS